MRKDAFYRTKAYVVGQICWEWLIQLKMWGAGDMKYISEAIHYHPMYNKSHVTDGDKRRNIKILDNGYIPREVFSGRYNYTGMCTLRGPDFRLLYWEIVDRFRDEVTGDHSYKLLWDRWAPICEE